MAHKLWLKFINLKQEHIKLHKALPTTIHLSSDDETELELLNEHLRGKEMDTLRNGTHRVDLKTLAGLMIKWDSEETRVE